MYNKTGQYFKKKLNVKIKSLVGMQLPEKYKDHFKFSAHIFQVASCIPTNESLFIFYYRPPVIFFGFCLMWLRIISRYVTKVKSQIFLPYGLYEYSPVIPCLPMVRYLPALLTTVRFIYVLNVCDFASIVLLSSYTRNRVRSRTILMFHSGGVYRNVRVEDKEFFICETILMMNSICRFVAL